MATASRKHARMEEKVPFFYAILVAVFGRAVTASADSGGSSPFSTQALGINYGRVADNLPPPSVAVELMRQQLKVCCVKIYDADPQVLTALSGTGLQVVITVPNEQISDISSSPSVANWWIQTNVLPFYPSTLISTVMVGNEVLSPTSFSDPSLQAASQALLVPAMTNIHSALEDHDLDDNIKVTTSLAMDVLATSFPPSAGAFREDISAMVIQPMLDLIRRTDSYVFLDVYPFFAWNSDPTNISLAYALLDGMSTSAFDDQGFTYSNMLDAQVDATLAAMEKLGYPDVRLVISETGWPTKGDDGQLGASVANAARYNQNLVRKTLAEPPAGTPRRPNSFIPVFVFSLFNEDQKPGPTTERNWGLFKPDGTPVYSMVLSTDAVPVSRHFSVSNGSVTESGQWCVVSSDGDDDEDDDADLQSLQTALDYACAAGGDCSMIEANQPCFLPDTVVSHASYAFNSYWQRKKADGATCDFNGAAALTTVDPSFGECVFELED